MISQPPIMAPLAMNDELNRKLLKKHPKILSFDEFVSESAQRDIECCDGWFLLLDKLCSEIQDHVDQYIIPQVRLTQIKEKFGELRIYYSGGDEHIRELIDTAKSVSKLTCESCGGLGHRERTRHGWIKTLCFTCLADVNRD